MDGMYKEFNAEHWKLSSVVIAKASRLARFFIARCMKRKRGREMHKRNGPVFRGTTEVVFKEQQDRGISRVAKFIYNKLDKSEWTAKRDIKNALPSRDRGFFDPAVEELGERIEMEEKPNAQGRGTVYYRRAL